MPLLPRQAPDLSRVGAPRSRAESPSARPDAGGCGSGACRRRDRSAPSDRGRRRLDLEGASSDATGPAAHPGGHGLFGPRVRRADGAIRSLRTQGALTAARQADIAQASAVAACSSPPSRSRRPERRHLDGAPPRRGPRGEGGHRRDDLSLPGRSPGVAPFALVPGKDPPRRFGIARSTFYLWRDRYRELGEAGLARRKCDFRLQAPIRPHLPPYLTSCFFSDVKRGL
ncbi:MAG: helix-turn-helix domain-containing protein [bacterium]|nr:helix-turn-helix domain-containing protein [bacterium]